MLMKSDANSTKKMETIQQLQHLEQAPLNKFRIIRFKKLTLGFWWDPISQPTLLRLIFTSKKAIKDQKWSLSLSLYASTSSQIRLSKWKQFSNKIFMLSWNCSDKTLEIGSKKWTISRSIRWSTDQQSPFSSPQSTKKWSVWSNSSQKCWNSALGISQMPQHTFITNFNMTLNSLSRKNPAIFMTSLSKKQDCPSMRKLNDFLGKLENTFKLLKPPICAMEVMSLKL